MLIIQGGLEPSPEACFWDGFWDALRNVGGDGQALQYIRERGQACCGSRFRIVGCLPIMGVAGAVYVMPGYVSV